jgi:hypothetical protein
MPIRVIKHEVIPGCGSFEVRFPDGIPSRYFYWEDVPSRRLRPLEQLTSQERPWSKPTRVPEKRGMEWLEVS